MSEQPFSFATVITDGERQDEQAARQGQRLPPDVAYAFGALAHRATAWVEATYMAGFRDQPRQEVADHIATVRAALDRLVAVRVSASEAARMTGYSKAHIKHLITTGALYAEREGRDWRIPVYALDALPPRSSRGRPRQAVRDAH